MTHPGLPRQFVFLCGENDMLPNSALPVRADDAIEQRQAKPTRQKQVLASKPVKQQADVTIEIKGDEVHLSFEGQRRYRIRGLERNHSSQQLKVNILAARDELVHLDTLDLYKARSRTSFIKATASELFTANDIIKRDSRRLDSPLALLIQSGSAAGKTTLMDAALSFMPAEAQIRYSAMTGQSLYYMGEQNMKHKILAISEEEGVAQASYALKLLQSDGKLTIAAVGKSNNHSGRQSTETYTVEGPVMMFLTTTSEHPDPELQNRCITLRVNESSDQTAQIHDRQRTSYVRSKTKRSPDEIRALHQNAQRLLASLPVIMPWAQQLTFRHDQTRMRRDNAKYLSLIASITLLHQHQRKLIDLGSGKIAVESTAADVRLANELISASMGKSLDDLLPQTRQLLVLIDDLVNQQSKSRKIDRTHVRFTQRQLRDTFGWGDYQLRRHLKRLIEMEYVLAQRTGHNNGRQYQLLYDGQGRDGQSFLLGLVDPAMLK
jgi:hypothetical protein